MPPKRTWWPRGRIRGSAKWSKNFSRAAAHRALKRALQQWPVVSETLRLLSEFGLGAQATRPECRRAYLRMCKQLHPDKQSSSAAATASARASAAAFIDMQASYDWLISEGALFCECWLCGHEEFYAPLRERLVADYTCGGCQRALDAADLN